MMDIIKSETFRNFAILNKALLFLTYLVHKNQKLKRGLKAKSVGVSKVWTIVLD